MCIRDRGLKGVNYYVYTGGPNFPDTGTTCDIYDYNAHVHADGSLNETYESLKTFGKFMESHAWICLLYTSCFLEELLIILKRLVALLFGQTAQLPFEPAQKLVAIHPSCPSSMRSTPLL